MGFLPHPNTKFLMVISHTLQATDFSQSTSENYSLKTKEDLPWLGKQCCLEMHSMTSGQYSVFLKFSLSWGNSGHFVQPLATPTNLWHINEGWIHHQKLCYGNVSWFSHPTLTVSHCLTPDNFTHQKKNGLTKQSPYILLTHTTIHTLCHNSLNADHTSKKMWGQWSWCYMLCTKAKVKFRGMRFLE